MAQLYSIADPTAHGIRLPRIKHTYTCLLDREKTVPRELKLDNFSEYQIMINDDALRVFFPASTNAAGDVCLQTFDTVSAVPSQYEVPHCPIT